jgi:hypothetical protein
MPIKRYSKKDDVVAFYSEEYPSIVVKTLKDGNFLVLDVRSRVLKKSMLTRDPDLGTISTILRYYLVKVFDHQGIIAKYPNIFTLSKLTKIQLFKKLTIENDLKTEMFINFFGQLELDKHAEDKTDSDIEKVNNFTVFFPSKMQKSRRDKFKRVLLDLQNIYKKHGLEKVATGEVRFSPLNSKTRGLYFNQTDDIKINSSMDSDLQLLYVLVHECAHRLMYKFIPNKTGEIVKIFNEKQMSVSKERKLPFQVGDELISKHKKYAGTYRIDWLSNTHVILNSIPTERFTLTVNSSKDQIKKAKSGFYKIIDKISNQEMILNGPYYKFNLPIDNFLTLDLFDIPKKYRTENVIQLVNASDSETVPNFKTSLKFPTKYSETNYAEWFAECVTLYMFDALDGEIKKIIENLIKKK